MDLNNKNTLTPCLKDCNKPVHCPGLMADGHFVTNWTPRKDYNKQIMIKFNEFDEHRLRALLLSAGPKSFDGVQQSEEKKFKYGEPGLVNATSDLSNVTSILDDISKYTCKPSNPIDSSMINGYFDKLIFDANKAQTNLEGYSKSKSELYYKLN